MSIVNLASLVSVLPQGFDEHMKSLWNREARTLKMMNVKEGHGLNVAFIANTGGQQATTFSDGYDVQNSEFLSDVKIPLVLQWAQYRSSFSISQRAIDAAHSSRGGAVELLDLFMQGIFESSTAVMSKLNQDVDAGAGTSDSLLGFSNSVLAAGSYAGQSLTTYPLLAGNVTTAVGALTSDALAAMETKMFNSCGRYADVITMPPALHQKYTALGLGVINNVQGLPAKQYNLSVRDDGVFWKGIPVIRDKDQATGTVRFISLDECHLRMLPPVQAIDSVVYKGITGEDGVSSTGIPLIIESLAKTGPSTKITIRTPSMQFVVTRPNAQGLMTGVT
jgi:hypothetical protein